MFSLCENFPKGLGEVFCQWMMYNNYGEILLHVERAASGGRQDVASMATMETLWNINYSVEFLDDMISYFSNSENILEQNLMILLSSVDIIAVSCICYILHTANVILMRWLAACTHKMKEYGWGYISMGKLLDKPKDNLNMIVDQPGLIHEESLVMVMMDPWAVELPPFQDYLYHKLKQHNTNYLNSTKTTKSVPLKELLKYMFSPTNQGNTYITKILEDLVVVAATRWVQ